MSDAEEIAMFAIASGAHQRVLNYVDRGRRYAEASEEALSEILKKCLEIVSEAPVNFDGRLAFDDVCSEYDLRNIYPPYDQYKDLLERFIAQAVKHSENLSEEEKERINFEMVAEYEKAHQNKN